MNRFVGELRRRKVLGTAAIHLIGSWTAVQIAATVVPLFEWPLWTVKLVLFVALGALPIVLIWSWVYDITDEGVLRTHDSLDGVHSSGHARALVVAGIPLFLLGVFVTLLIVGGYSYSARHIRKAEATAQRLKNDTEIPAEAIILYSRAQLYEDMGQREKAEELYRRLQAEFPQMEEAKSRLPPK